MGNRTTRREFLKQAILSGAAVAGLPGVLGTTASAATTYKARVVIACDTAMLRGDEVNQAAVGKALSRALVALTEKKSARDAWRSMFKPDDVVGIKISTLFGKFYATRPEVVNAVIAGLRSAGVKPENIIVWDRASSELIKSGFKPNKTGPGTIYWADDGDWGKKVRNGVFDARISTVFDRITALINLPILKHHHITGITCALKNHYGSFENHGQYCTQDKPYMADLNSLPQIKNKTRLVVADALKPQAHLGPERIPTYLWDHYTLLVGTDPVAVDTRALEILEERRKQLKLDSLAEQTKWLAAAAERGIGVNDPAQIEIVRV